MCIIIIIILIIPNEFFNIAILHYILKLSYNNLAAKTKNVTVPYRNFYKLLS